MEKLCPITDSKGDLDVTLVRGDKKRITAHKTKTRCVNIMVKGTTPKRTVKL